MTRKQTTDLEASVLSARPTAWRSLGAAVLMAFFASASNLSGSTALAQTDVERPDFSGVWFPAGMQRTNPLPYNENARRLIEEYEAQFAIDDDPGFYCIWPGLPRSLWGAPFAIEIFHRPQDLTIYWEGYGMYRKVYMADHNPPAPVLHTAMGHSVAHWEGDTLVVETTHLKEYPYMTRVANTADARFVERMRLEEREVDGEVRTYLVNEGTLIDPKLYSEPVETRAQIVRRPDLHVLEYTCTDILWEQYLQQRGLTLPDVNMLPTPD
jgi:hypothetical protein